MRVGRSEVWAYERVEGVPRYDGGGTGFLQLI